MASLVILSATSSVLPSFSDFTTLLSALNVINNKIAQNGILRNPKKKNAIAAFQRENNDSFRISPIEFQIMLTPIHRGHTN